MEKKTITLENNRGQVTVDLLRQGYGAAVEIILTGSEIRICVKTKLNPTLSTWEEEEFIVPLPDDGDCPRDGDGEEEGEPWEKATDDAEDFALQTSEARWLRYEEEGE